MYVHLVSFPDPQYGTWTREEGPVDVIHNSITTKLTEAKPACWTSVNCVSRSAKVLANRPLRDCYLQNTKYCLVPRPFPPPVFNHILYAKTEGEGLGSRKGHVRDVR